MQLTKRPILRAQSCTECRRRKQKCIPSKHGRCLNCARRYPPVPCIGMSAAKDLIRLNKIRSSLHIVDETQQFHKQEKRDINSKIKSEVIEDRPLCAAISDGNSFGGQLNETCLAELEGKVICLLNKGAGVQPKSTPNLLSAGGKSLEDEPRAFGGLLAEINSTNVVSIYSSRQNTELFHLFHQTVAPFMFTLTPDGQNIPTIFQEQVLPWIMQSPLMPQIAIFTALAYRTHTSGCELENATQTIALKGEIYSNINNLLEQDFEKIHLQAIQSVLQLVLLEWYSHDLVSLCAQMEGLKEMIRLRGGITKLQNSLLRQLLILTDYELACYFQRDLHLIQPHELTEIPASVLYPESYRSPLAESRTTFREIYENLDLNPLAANILDEICSLTTSLLFSATEANSPNPTKTSSFKYVQRAASQIYGNIASFPIIPVTPTSPSPDIIYEVIRLTSLAYATCISTLTPFNLAYAPSVRHDLYSKIILVKLSTWKKVPGIFLWILLVLCPGSRYHAPLLLKSNVSATALYISFTDFGLAVECLRSFWMVQRMISNVKKQDGDGEGEI